MTRGVKGSGAKARVTLDEVIAAYRDTGSIWKAGQRLGISGQAVHERLIANGHRLQNRKWSSGEDERLRTLLANGYTAGQAANELGRTFAAVTSRLHEIGVSSYAKKRERKVAEDVGYDEASIRSHMEALERAPTLPPTRYCRQHGLAIDRFVRACQRHDLARWVALMAGRGSIPSKDCENCGVSFPPTNGKQRFCTRKCSADHRADRRYFNGNRSQAVGMAAGVCQLCGREGHRGLAAHHVLGKENDPEDENLVAVCNGCHQLVTMLASRPFLDGPDAEANWSSLISLVWFRRNGGELAQVSDDQPMALFVSVDIDFEEDQDDGW